MDIQEKFTFMQLSYAIKNVALVFDKKFAQPPYEIIIRLSSTGREVTTTAEIGDNSIIYVEIINFHFVKDIYFPHDGSTKAIDITAKTTFHHLHTEVIELFKALYPNPELKKFSVQLLFKQQPIPYSSEIVHFKMSKEDRVIVKLSLQLDVQFPEIT